MRTALVNTNRMRPPIGPIGLDYVAQGLSVAGFGVDLLDLCWEDDWRGAVAAFFGSTDYDLVGITLRNTDDCAYSPRQAFLEGFVEIVSCIRSCTGAVLVLGGVGFSTMPEQVLELCGSRADAGVWADGEAALTAICSRMAVNRPWRDIPNLVWHRDGQWVRKSPAMLPGLDLPPMRRDFVDNRRYFQEGGQAGIETKRGCPGACVYCADPMAKGKLLRVRSAEAVADELEHLLQQGIDHIHTCDSEFNIPAWHATSVCNEMIRRGLGDRIRWYAYCSPIPFSAELARAMSRAGCAGVNFGVDSGDEAMLRSLGRPYGPRDIIDAARLCRQEGIPVMFDLLLGAPGESRESIGRTMDLVMLAAPDRAGLSVGVRVYPGTRLSEAVASTGGREPGDGVVGGDGPNDPVFFLEPAVAPFIFDLLDRLVGSDRRFLFFDPGRPDRNYNYNSNERLIEAIGKGYRGAYWDILRRYG